MESKIKIFSQKWWINKRLNMYNKMKLDSKILGFTKLNFRKGSSWIAKNFKAKSAIICFIFEFVSRTQGPWLPITFMVP